MQSWTHTSFDRVAPRQFPELMDHPACGREELRDALEVVGRTNRLGGTTALLARVTVRALRNGGRPRLHILDVGTGCGDLALVLARELRAPDRELSFVLSDLHGVTLGIARERVSEHLEPGVAEIHYVRLTAPLLPFKDASFDFAVSSTLLHHLEEDEAVRFISELDRVTRTGWAVADLCRSLYAYGAIRLLAGTIWRRHEYPRHDGPISVRRAFTVREAERLTREAGVRTVSVRRLRPFRLLIEGGRDR